jgi:brefeldin A-inhibited guanine nucleotide-exchange protein
MLTSDKPAFVSGKAELQEVKEQEEREIQKDQQEGDDKQNEAEGLQQAASERDDEDEVKPEVPPKDIMEENTNGAHVEQQQQADVAPPEIHEPEPTDGNAPPDARMRSDSRSTTATFATHRSTMVSSTVFIVTALDAIGASREARRSKELVDSVQVALANVRQSDGQPIDPELIFRPLHLASKALSIPLQVTALDCIGKLITYSYFAFPSAESESEATPEKPPLIERAIDAICDCFENEATPNEIQQQIIKSLLAAVLNDKIVVHGAGLLKAVRQIYNIFIYSKSNQNQQIAQGSLTQMVSTVFDRVRIRLDLKELRSREVDKVTGASLDTSASDQGLTSEVASVSAVDQGDQGDQSDQPVSKEPNSEKLTLQSFESPKEVTSVNDNAPTTVTRAKMARSNTARSMSGIPEDREDDSSTEDDVDEVYVKDAFLVFRALCKLSHKVLGHDQQQDIKSQNMRSKLLSLHLIHYLINNHITTFTSPLAAIKNSSSSSTEAMTLLQAVRPHLCLSLSRNGSSSVPHVFKVCCEIFWLMLKDMRVMMKKELEVFLKEIYLAILEKRTAPSFQKQYFMEVLERLGGDPRALVEIYLNYDCDRTALENIFQNIVEQLSRYSSLPVTTTASQQQYFQDHHTKMTTIGAEWRQRGTLPPSFTTANITPPPQPTAPNIPSDYILKHQAVECLVEMLRSLDNWGSQRLDDQAAAAAAAAAAQSLGATKSMDNSRESLDTNVLISPRPEISDAGTGPSTPVPEDDPNEIEKVKQRKIAMMNAIQHFNFKPKRGIKLLLSEGFIRSDTPEDIAGFLLRSDRLDKAMLGEYLGEGDAENIAIMHQFVDQMDFTKRRFVDALRSFLQHFRLPGEAQKIDRFMLKFAERYTTQNPNAFANADTAYVLSYSVIMLNTDQHSSKMKGPRMTKEDFIKNNRGINDNQDLPTEYLISIYDEIANKEIVLDTEREHAANLGIPTSAPTGLATRAGQVFATVGRDIQGEKYAQASEEMANKTEQLYRSLIRAQRKTAVRDALSRFIPATSVRHVGSMFNVTWMSFLSGLSAPMQDTQNLETIRLCMEGLKLAIRISCEFDLDTPRVAFVTALAKFTNLANVREMMPKNVEALKALLDVAFTEGNRLRGSWREILTCVSQLDRLQLLSDGVDEGSLPDVSRVPTASSDTASRKSMQSTRRPRPRSVGGPSAFRMEIAMESRSADMVRGVDRIFTNTANLSHEAIIDFVRALSAVSWQEIQSSGHSDSPRTYSLQKLVEISYYNMTRVRIEWSKIWEVLGQHFNQVGCHSNTTVVFFALDSLRQLSMRFMEIGELPGFKFQKDFLKPFEHVMANSTTAAVKDMILRCLIQMIQARGDNIRSGWKTMFGVFTVAAREPYGKLSSRLSYLLRVMHQLIT